jgi:SAM-dependent methyltransferase
MDGVASPPPNCPITGLPAARRIQLVSSSLLIALWRMSLGVSTARQLGAVSRFGLWESSCGLAFFEPMIAGDKDFYEDLYGRLGVEGPWTGVPVERSDYPRAAALIRPGESVLDVGCGPAGFARHVPQARYVGLDQSAEARKVAADVRGETIAGHAKGHPSEYDVVCSFHVLEHVAQPRSFAADMVRCLRPGGLLIIAVPSWPSAMTDIPNFPFNAPPHHLSWWTEDALRALAEGLGLIFVSVEKVRPSPFSSIIYWMGRAAPKLTGTRFFRHAWGWHLALLWSWIAGRVCNRLCRLPARAHSFELLLIARKPG